VNAQAFRILCDLVAALPKCSYCDKPATRAFRRGAARYCDDHKAVVETGNEAPEYSRAVPLREAVKLLAEAAP
jgi:hypothetical protein